MDSANIISFIVVPLLLIIVIDCERKKVYRLNLVKNIAEPLERHEDYFDEVETTPPIFIDTDQEKERTEICESALSVYKENIESTHKSLEYLKNEKAGATKSYALDLHSNSKPKLIEAFKCPTCPALYIFLRERPKDELLVTILVRESDVKLPVQPTEDICYKAVLVQEISPVRSRDAGNYKGATENIFDTNDLSENSRLDMCAKAINIDILSGRIFKFYDNSDTDVRRLYVIQSEKSSSAEVMVAFRCPTSPAIYLKVRRIHESNCSMLYVTVIVNIQELPPKFDEIEFRPQLKDAVGSSKNTVKQDNNISKKKMSSSSRSMFADGFVERHDLEQYFWTEATVKRLMDALRDFENECCCLTTPSLAHGWHLEGREEVLLDIDKRFDYLPKFIYYDIRYPHAVEGTFRIVILDPPFFYIPMDKIFEAVCKIVDNDFKTKIIVGFLKREEKELMKYFNVFNIKPTKFPLEYATVKPNKWKNYCLYSNIDLPGIKRINNVQ